MFIPAPVPFGGDGCLLHVRTCVHILGSEVDDAILAMGMIAFGLKVMRKFAPEHLVWPPVIKGGPDDEDAQDTRAWVRGPKRVQ